MNPATISRIYRQGGAHADHIELRDNTVILEPVREPLVTASGIHLTGKTVERAGVTCFLYRVLTTGKLTRPEDLKVYPGDIVDVVNAMLDPIHKNEEALRVDVKHIFALFERGEAAKAARANGILERAEAIEAAIEAQMAHLKGEP